MTLMPITHDPATSTAFLSLVLLLADGTQVRRVWEVPRAEAEDLGADLGPPIMEALVSREEVQYHARIFGAVAAPHLTP